MNQEEIQKDVYVIIPTEEYKIKTKKLKQNNNVLNMYATLIKSSYSQSQLQSIIKSKTYNKILTQDLSKEFFVIANQIEDALRNTNFDSYKINSTKYIEEVLSFELDNILSEKNNKGETIKQQLKNLFIKYSYDCLDINDFCIFLYFAFEITYLHGTKNTKKLPVLFEKYISNDSYITKEPSKESRLKYFLEKYDKYFKIRFSLLENEKYKNNENEREHILVFATSEIKVSIAFEVLSAVSSGIARKRYDVCKNENCHNLFYVSDIRKEYCGEDICKSDKVQKCKKSKKTIKI